MAVGAAVLNQHGCGRVGRVWPGGIYGRVGHVGKCLSAPRITHLHTLRASVLLQVANVCMAMVTPRAVRHVHFNNAGDSPSPPRVTSAVTRHMDLESEVGGYRAAELADLQGVYESAARLIGAGREAVGGGAEDAKNYNARDEIALVESATVGWTRVFYSMLETKEREALARTKNSDSEEEEMVVLVSEAEYAANLVASVKFARDHSTPNSRFRWRVFPIPSATAKGEGATPTTSGMVDLQAFQSMLDGTYPIGDPGGKNLDPASIKMVCITHIPTNSGIINPVEEIGAMIDEFNSRHERGRDDGELPQILYLVDACQSVGQISVDVRNAKCHSLAATGRKYLRGPRGTGFLYVQRNIANSLEPSHVDHAAAPVAKVMKQSPQTHGLEEANEFGLCHGYRRGAARFEFWEANIATRLGLGAAIDLALELGMDSIKSKCASLGGLLRERLQGLDGIHLYHVDSSACGIVTFSVDGLHAAAIKERMQKGFYADVDSANDGRTLCCYHLSVVPATSTPLDSASTGLGEKSLVRASLSYFNTEDEIALFCKALEIAIT